MKALEWEVTPERRGGCSAEGQSCSMSIAFSVHEECYASIVHSVGFRWELAGVQGIGNQHLDPLHRGWIRMLVWSVVPGRWEEVWLEEIGVFGPTYLIYRRYPCRRRDVGGWRWRGDGLGREQSEHPDPLMDQLSNIVDIVVSKVL